MGKNKKKKKSNPTGDVGAKDTQDKNPAEKIKLKNKEYEAELFKLQVELVKLQDWVKKTGARIVIIFEGRDAAGKGGIIKRILERVSPRVFRLVALPAPTERQKTQIYAQRYYRTSARGRRNRHLRPQLVQPRRGRACNGLLHRGGIQEVS
jgi:polyphosphate kinase 2 (PPK2 family)